LSTNYCSTRLYSSIGRAFPLLVCWSPDGDLTIFLHLFRQSDDVVQILPEAYSCARPRPALRKSRERHNLCVGSIVHVLAATIPVHRSSPLRLPPALPPLLCCLFLFFITPAPMQYPMGRWHSNSVCHPDSDCRTQPHVISNPSRVKLFSTLLPHSDWASLEQCLFSGAGRQCTRLPTQLTARVTQSRLSITSYQPLSLHSRNPPAHRPAGPAVCVTRSYSYFRVILLFMAALSRCMSSPQVTLPHAAHGTDSSCRGGQSYSQCSACCQSANRLCLRLLLSLLTARHPFFSTAARFTSSRLKCH
jgi:hypothetical protein